MCFAVILAATLGAFSDEPPPSPSKPDIAAYTEAAAQAGKNADAHVRLALWCEAHGMTAERLKHLALAVLYDPANTLARGLMGLVAYRGKWERPDEVSRARPGRPGAEGTDQGVSSAPRRAQRAGRRPLEARSLVRAKWIERAGQRASPPGHTARSQTG